MHCRSKFVEYKGQAEADRSLLNTRGKVRDRTLRLSPGSSPASREHRVITLPLLPLLGLGFTMSTVNDPTLRFKVPPSLPDSGNDDVS
ncbi:hypothetical protein IAQ61_000881 [Plenodomus lingam]|uniref:uncharacterized protein n=1 Tax=Leptosphaeria maculans TaxID=5022 RepID=UPI00332F8B9A|nr:hypothetical protein IAQ61_000881 [Plenodomus lingam]